QRLVVFATLAARLFGQRQPLLDRQGQEAALPLRVAYHLAELLVLDVVRAQGVAVHKQGRDAEQVDHYRLGQELDAGEFGEALADQKVPVAMDEIRRRGCAECAQRLQRRLIRRDGVVPYPGFVE